MLRKIISLVLSFGLLFQQVSFAQVATELNIGGYLARMHSAMTFDRFRPMHLRYFNYDLTTHDFKVLVDKGDIMKGLTPKGSDPEEKLQEETQTLLNYFLVGLTLHNESFWVNLRPDSEDQIIDNYLVWTDVGRIMLEADLQLKKDTARLTSPQTPEGKEYWSKLYKKAEEIYGYENITIPTLTRPWIVPGEIIIHETENSAYIYKATLKVMLEQDYLKDSSVYNFKDARSKALNDYSSELIRELIIPKLTKEVNSSKRYANIRQVYYSLILSRWFKNKFGAKKGLSPSELSQGNLKGTVPDFIDRINSLDLTGLTSKEPWSKTTYFKEYQKSFKEGEYNIKEPVYTPTGQVIRSYFSGGMDIKNINLGNGFIAKAAQILPNTGELMGGNAVKETLGSSPLEIRRMVGEFIYPNSWAYYGKYLGITRDGFEYYILKPLQNAFLKDFGRTLSSDEIWGFCKEIRKRAGSSHRLSELLVKDRSVEDENKKRIPQEAQRFVNLSIARIPDLFKKNVQGWKDSDPLDMFPWLSSTWLRDRIFDRKADSPEIKEVVVSLESWLRSLVNGVSEQGLSNRDVITAILIYSTYIELAAGQRPHIQRKWNIEENLWDSSIRDILENVELTGYELVKGNREAVFDENKIPFTFIKGVAPKIRSALNLNRKQELIYKVLGALRNSIADTSAASSPLLAITKLEMNWNEGSNIDEKLKEDIEQVLRAKLPPELGGGEFDMRNRDLYLSVDNGRQQAFFRYNFNKDSKQVNGAIFLGSSYGVEAHPKISLILAAGSPYRSKASSAISERISNDPQALLTLYNKIIGIRGSFEEVFGIGFGKHNINFEKSETVDRIGVALEKNGLSFSEAVYVLNNAKAILRLDSIDFVADGKCSFRPEEELRNYFEDAIITAILTNNLLQDEKDRAELIAWYILRNMQRHAESFLYGNPYTTPEEAYAEAYKIINKAGMDKLVKKILNTKIQEIITNIVSSFEQDGKDKILEACKDMMDISWNYGYTPRTHWFKTKVDISEVITRFTSLKKAVAAGSPLDNRARVSAKLEELRKNSGLPIATDISKELVEASDNALWSKALGVLYFNDNVYRRVEGVDNGERATGKLADADNIGQLIDDLGRQYDVRTGSFKSIRLGPDLKPKPREGGGETKGYLMDKDSEVTPEAYFMHRGIFASKEDILKAFYGDNKLRFDITIIPPALWGKEYAKTIGHYHFPVEYPEIYQVVSGEALWIMQKCKINETTVEAEITKGVKEGKSPAKAKEDAIKKELDKGVIEDFVVVRAKAGDIVIMLPGYGHVSINISETEPLVMADWLTWHQDSYYGSFNENKGAAFYAIKNDKGEIELVRDTEYKNLPEKIRQRAPRQEITEFGLKRGKPIYNLVGLKDFIEKTRFLYHPNEYSALLTPEKTLDDAKPEEQITVNTNFEGAAGSPNKISGEESASSAVQAVDNPGGIDFRALPMTIKPMGSFEGLNLRLPQLSSSALLSFNLGQEIEELNKMISGGIIPSGARVQELVAAAWQKGNLEEYQSEILTILAEICKLQEGDCCETSNELKIALVAANAV